ncbi:hypothetical protein TWF481_003168 [Arthrobotrys musiformis]|uniref:Uncharacterized protein n=1 Tax=Arthrobotrys musiformis TaxID=47236 RepID=A0AAV9VPG1_9PEZI
MSLPGSTSNRVVYGEAKNVNIFTFGGHRGAQNPTVSTQMAELTASPTPTCSPLRSITKPPLGIVCDKPASLSPSPSVLQLYYLESTVPTEFPLQSPPRSKRRALRMADTNPSVKEKKSLKSYLTTLTRKVSQKTATGAQQLGNLARSATITRSKTMKGRKNHDNPNAIITTTTTTTSVASVFIPPRTVTSPPPPLEVDGKPAPRLPNIVYRSPDADFIESHMEAKIRSIGSNGEAEKGGDEVKKKDRMGGYTIRIIDPNSNKDA